MMTYGGVNEISAARTGSMARNATSHAAVFSVEYLDRGVERNQLDRNIEAASQFVRQTDRYALWLAGLWILLREYGVTEVDGGANAAIGSQVMQYILAMDIHVSTLCSLGHPLFYRWRPIRFTDYN